MDLSLDRDRNYISDVTDFESKARNIINYILEHFREYKNKIESKQEQMDYSEIEMFDKFPEWVLQLLNQDDRFLGSDYFYISTNTADYL